MKHSLYNYNGTKVYLRKTEYRNNQTLAVLLNTADDEYYGTVTVNLNSPLQSDRMAFLDENNMPGIGRWLEKHKLAVPTGVSAQSGFCLYPLYQIL